MRHDPSLKRLVPLTALRHFYEVLRRFESTAFHRQAAEECLRRTDQLDDLVGKSLAHAALYDNRGEGFHERPSAGVLSPARLANEDPANQLLRLLAEDRFEVVGCPHLEFRYVDYEINPLRTTRSELESGESGRSSGAGGVDVLLASRADGLPVIAETKAATDRNVFFALIQGLMYAVELGTDGQRARLDHAYPGRFTWPASGPWLDLYLLLVRYPSSQKHAEFLDVAGRVAERLLAAGGPASHLLRRIVALSTPLDPTHRAVFSVAFAHGTGATVTPPTA